MHGSTALDPTSNKGQVIRYIPQSENQDAAKMWQSICFLPPLKELTDKEFLKKFDKQKTNNPNVLGNIVLEEYFGHITVDQRPEFEITKWEQTKAPEDGLRLNLCWPEKIAR